MELTNRSGGAVFTGDEDVVVPLRANTERREDAVVLRLAGEVDSYTAPVLRDHLAAAFTGIKNVPVVVDLTGVSFFGSSGLSLLVEYHELGVDRGTPLRLVAPAGSVLRALRATTLDQMLELYFSVPEALASR